MSKLVNKILGRGYTSHHVSSRDPSGPKHQSAVDDEAVMHLKRKVKHLSQDRTVIWQMLHKDADTYVTYSPKFLHHNSFLQIQGLEADIRAAQTQNHELAATIDKMQADERDKATKDTLRFQILLDMFALQVLQNCEASVVEQVQ
jgi:hypothetical protein